MVLRYLFATLLCSGLLLGGCANTPPSQPPATQTDTGQHDTAAAQADLQRQANRGDLDSQFQLGSSYFVGQPEKNLKQAEYWWKQAADKGHAMAAVSLAYLYTGRDAPEFANQRDMLKYLNQSAAAGNPMAQHVLGNLYRRGEGGVSRDPDQAQRLYQSACQQNYEPSCMALGQQ